MRQRPRPAADAHRHRRAGAPARGRRPADPGEPGAADRARDRPRRDAGARRPARRADLRPTSARFSPAQLARLGLGARRGARADPPLPRARPRAAEGAADATPSRAGSSASAASGPWSVGVVCLEGLGRYERGLARDLGLVKLAVRALGPLGRGGGDRRAARALRRVGGPRERLSPGRAAAGVSYPCPMAGSPPELHVVRRPGRAPSRGCSPSRPRRGGSIVLTGGSTPGRAYERAAALEPDWGRVVALVGRRALRAAGRRALELPARARRRCSTGSRRRRAQIHRIRGELPPAEAADELDEALDGVELDLMLLGLGPRRPHGLALPGLAAARGRGPARDQRAGRARAVRRPRDDDAADDPLGEADRLPRHRRATRPTPSRAPSGAISRPTCPPASPAWPRFPSRSSSTSAAASKLERMSSPSRSRRPQDVLEIDRPEQLKALGHPLRLKVLQVLGESDEPLTNRELAARLSVDPGHLHFHVRMLHRAGLIELAEAGGTREAVPPGREAPEGRARDPRCRAGERAPGRAAARAAARLRAARGERRVPQRAGAREARRSRRCATLLNELLDEAQRARGRRRSRSRRSRSRSTLRSSRARPTRA